MKVEALLKSITIDFSTLEYRYEYDAFGQTYTEDFNSTMNLSYIGKLYDTVTGLYNYGYCDQVHLHLEIFEYSQRIDPLSLFTDMTFTYP